MLRSLRGAAALAVVAFWGVGGAQAAPARTPSPPGAVVYFQSPGEGTAHNPVVVRAGLSGMGVVPAGAAATNAGHHNILVDTAPGDLDKPLPRTANVVRLDDGETEVQVNLSNGWHQLRLVLTDGQGMNFDPPVESKPISIYVRRH